MKIALYHRPPIEVFPQGRLSDIRKSLSEATCPGCGKDFSLAIIYIASYNDLRTPISIQELRELKQSKEKHRYTMIAHCYCNRLECNFEGKYLRLNQS